jgi:acid phosphatase
VSSRRLAASGILVFALLAPACASTHNHELLDAVLWTQTAAEHDLLYRQAFVLAAEHVKNGLDDPSWTAMPLEQTGDYQSLPPAVVFDADETIIDNGEYEAELIKEKKSYDGKLFDDVWIPLAAAKATPGALEFMRWLKEKGVEPIVITNRNDPPSKAPTLKNLLDLGFPLKADGSTVLLREKKEWYEKAARRAVVAKSYRVLLLLGDDLGDFVTITDADLAKRRALADRFKDYWGVKWIVLPNPMYGSWERALYPKNATEDAERLRLKSEKLRGFRK